ncbi:sensor histidine kinase [Paramicrobacterium agarici]|uniref:sensor histidine kinase n=1 Tax=Paramicrobacterium agarici TaxID=630514 RepID=UPI00116C7DF5|nr:sensor histidine kinase [Microbacterium agarici]TQO23677.1 signal transduction histidine kinase [Microbacterium agarici]
MSSVSFTRARPRWRAIAYIAVEAGWWLVGLFYLCAALAVAPFLLLFVGWYAVPTLVDWLDQLAGNGRERAARFARSPIPERTPRVPHQLSFGDRVALVRTPEFTRNATWALAHLIVMPVIIVVGLGLPIIAVNSSLVPLYWWSLPANDPAITLFPITSWPLAVLSSAIGLAAGLIGWLILPSLARRTAGSTLAMLWPDRVHDMQERIESLSRSRAAALDAHSNELRRIERELHDGAQNRLVGVVMMIGLAQRTLKDDPDKAASFLVQAQDAASDALTGLREMVHDIYPPVLDELGLSGAASTLTSRSGVPTALDVSGLQRAPAAVESAAYFVLAEALTNAAKYADASRISVALSTITGTPEDVLVVEVDDDGRGGATIGGAGSGLAGVARRAEALGGTLTLSSPIGGPTHLKVELPCGF